MSVEFVEAFREFVCSELFPSLGKVKIVDKFECHEAKSRAIYVNSGVFIMKRFHRGLQASILAIIIINQCIKSIF